MSLLFDALKRLQGSADGPPPISPPSEPYQAMPSAAEAATFSQPREGGVEAARALVAATTRTRRLIVPLVVGSIAILAAGIAGVWFYYHIQTPRWPQPPPRTAAPIVATAVPETPPQAPPMSQEPAIPSATDIEQVPEATMPPTRQTVAAAAATSSLPAKNPVNGDEPSPQKAIPKTQPAPLAMPSRQPEKGRPVAKQAAAQVSTADIRLSAIADPLKYGYAALTEGRLDEAERNYLEVIAKRPWERDALLGLAVIAHRRMQTERAAELYQQVLREDPGNATATAALVNLSGQVDPLAAESRLKELLDAKPGSSELHHALANVLARQKRWSEAQQAFFRAYSLEPGNALYAYNLAVALDRLRQPATALPYYELSARLAKPGDAAIDRNAIQRRVQELRGSLPENTE